MQNLEQIRARNAMAKANDVKASDGEGNAISGYPSLIMSNGLLATVAFSLQKGGQMERIADAIAFHLSHICEPGQAGNLLAGAAQNASGLIKQLTDQKADSLLLQRCTAESLAFLAYLKRFA
jgi:CRISPR/Cas system CMR-associated protein Cmr5 small subunit